MSERDDDGDDVDDVAADLWRALVDLWFDESALPHAAARYALTPGHARALMKLEPGRPMSMGALAVTLEWDPSMVTAVVDRLEQHGLAERQPSTSDRRVKLLALTSAGVAARDDILAQVYRPPAELLALPPSDLRALGRILKRLKSAAPQAGA